MLWHTVHFTIWWALCWLPFLIISHQLPRFFSFKTELHPLCLFLFEGWSWWSRNQFSGQTDLFYKICNRCVHLPRLWKNSKRPLIQTRRKGLGFKPGWWWCIYICSVIGRYSSFLLAIRHFICTCWVGETSTVSSIFQCRVEFLESEALFFVPGVQPDTTNLL